MQRAYFAYKRNVHKTDRNEEKRKCYLKECKTMLKLNLTVDVSH